MRTIDHCTTTSSSPVLSLTFDSSSVGEWFAHLTNLNYFHESRRPKYRLVGWVNYNFVGQSPKWGLAWICLDCEKKHPDRSNRTAEPANHSGWHAKKARDLDSWLTGL